MPEFLRVACVGRAPEKLSLPEAHTYLREEITVICNLIKTLTAPLYFEDMIHLPTLDTFTLKDANEAFGLHLPFERKEGSSLRIPYRRLVWNIHTYHEDGNPVQTTTCSTPSSSGAHRLRIDRRGVLETDIGKVSREIDIHTNSPRFGEFKAGISVSPKTLLVRAEAYRLLVKRNLPVTCKPIFGEFTHEGILISAS